MFTVKDNIDQLIREVAKLENSNKYILKSRQLMKTQMSKYVKIFAAVTPVATGEARKSIKIKSRTRAGRTRVSLIWTATKTYKRKSKKSGNTSSNLPYINAVNFNKKNASGVGFATKKFKSMKKKIDTDMRRAIRQAFKGQL